MNADAQTVLADLKAKREIHSPALHVKDYWHTYVLMVVYGVALASFSFVDKQSYATRYETLMLYMFLVLVVAIAIQDSQRAVNRRFDRLVELLEKKGML
jgi:dolichyl-phosphate-mannose--protein O-mannosyl transferase